MKSLNSFLVTLLVGGYITLQLISDVTAVKIVAVAGVTVPAAVFLYAVTFTWRDLIHKQLGRSWARASIIVAALCNLFMAGYFSFTVSLPNAPFWQFQDAYATTLGVVWRIMLASICAEVVSELLDTEVYHLVVARLGHRRQWLRVLGSNAVSLPLDSVIFVTLAFAGTMPTSALVSIVAGQVAVKAVITVVSLPMIYLIPEAQAD